MYVCVAVCLRWDHVAISLLFLVVVQTDGLCAMSGGARTSYVNVLIALSVGRSRRTVVMNCAAGPAGNTQNWRRQ